MVLDLIAAKDFDFAAMVCYEKADVTTTTVGLHLIDTLENNETRSSENCAEGEPSHCASRFVSILQKLQFFRVRCLSPRPPRPNPTVSESGTFGREFHFGEVSA
jgi:hypothetical protein